MKAKASEMQTVGDMVRWALSEFERHQISLGHGTADNWEEATFLVLRMLKLPFDRLNESWNCRLSQQEAELVMQAIEKRAHEKVPTPYILNEAWLKDVEFYVDERVIIPRSFIAELLNDGSLTPWIGPDEEVQSVLDLCTGQGSIAILAQDQFPCAQVTAADISDDALEVAAINLEKHGLTDWIELVKTDLFDNLEGRRFDLILSNPPYVTQDAMDALPEEYLKEPALALGAGEDGMDILRRMMPELLDHLTENGVAVVEIGDGREAFEAIWPTLPVTWLTTSAGDDMVFLVTAADLRDHLEQNA